jgi:hypothetical protein
MPRVRIVLILIIVAVAFNKTSKNGITSYSHSVLEAKIVSPNGFCFSLATEWIENSEGEYDKQDCEINAFKRLAKKIKSFYPQLPILLVADELYATAPVIEITLSNHWDYMIVLQDCSQKN